MEKNVKTLIRGFCNFETFPQDFFLETVETRDRDRDQAFETKPKILKSRIPWLLLGEGSEATEPYNKHAKFFK